MPQDESPPPPTQDELLWTRQIHGVVGLVLAGALAVAALIEATEVTPARVDLDSARAALAQARSFAPDLGSDRPALLLSRGHEEVLWHARGELRLQPPWEPPRADFVALAHEPLALPRPDSAVHPASPLVTEGAWVARAYQGPSPGRRPGARARRAPKVALMDRLHTARVEVRPKKGEPRRCAQYRFGRWFCGPDPWHFVGATEMNVVGAPARCIWMHPHDNAELRLTFSDLPRERPLKGRITFSDEAAATSGGGAVTFRVEVDGEEVLKRVHPNRRGWSFFQVDLSEPTQKAPKRGAAKDKAPGDTKGGAKGASRGERAEVTFVVSARQTGRRHFCVTAEIEDRAKTREAP